MTGKPYSARLRPEPDQLSKLRAKHGQDLEDFRRERFGHGYDALTQSEARYLSRSPDADTIRNRLAEKEPARDRGLREEDPESGVTPIRDRCCAGPVRGDEGPADAGPSVSRLSDAAPLGQGGTKANDRSAAALGTEATAYTVKGQAIGVRYVLAEAAGLVASHDVDGRVYPELPASLSAIGVAYQVKPGAPATCRRLPS
ncbi:MAG: hypothetical protein M3461_08845 [Pseudomonadota bacterium]|nr:hypothetical protein [Pseudomonadota bacterium]